MRARNDLTPASQPVSYFVVHTRPNAEQRAYRRLRAQQYSLYFPRIKVQRCHGGKVDWSHRPFLPRYMFVEDDGRGVSDIKRTDGVSDVVRAGFVPVRVRSDVVERIRLRERDGFVQLDGPLARAFRPGELLRVTDGALLGRDVLFSRMSGATRAIVFLNAVIGRVESSVHVAALEKVRVAAA